MRTIKTTTGSEVTLDGDLLAIMEMLYREVTAKRALERTFDDMVKEIHHLIDQMSEDERRTYLVESLFLNTVSYENDKLEAYMKKLSEEIACVAELPGDPVPVHVAVGHPGDALRRPLRLRLRRPLRAARPWRRAFRFGARHVDRTDDYGAARGSERGRLEILQRLRR